MVALAACLAVVACADHLSRSRTFLYVCAAAVGVLALSLLVVHTLPDGVKTLGAVLASLTQMTVLYGSASSWIPLPYAVAYAATAAFVGAAAAHVLWLKNMVLEDSATSDVVFAGLSLGATVVAALAAPTRDREFLPVALCLLIAGASAWRRHTRAARTKEDDENSDFDDDDDDEPPPSPPRFVTRRGWQESDETQRAMEWLYDRPEFRRFLVANSHRVTLSRA